MYIIATNDFMHLKSVWPQAVIMHNRFLDDGKFSVGSIKCMESLVYWTVFTVLMACFASTQQANGISFYSELRLQKRLLLNDDKKLIIIFTNF